eukprot:TRINITY_DN6670_c0_g2_i3.p1 TRINITY_DN6670_c0_g2~~TRINITY_DN6670_c0_g2_i3.p1  ORF type:complete len:156 (+),score=34.84 TRINITY_DN6670_c0_g2_i3:180-647(+)
MNKKEFEGSMLPKEYSENLRKIVGLMLRKDPKARPNAEGVLKELLRQPLFNESRERFENRGTESEHKGVLPDNDLTENYKPEDYYGELVNNIRHGKGNCSLSLGLHVHTNGIYDGVWRYNKAAGKGIAHYNNGDMYDGDWLDNKLHGKGIFSIRN